MISVSDFQRLQDQVLQQQNQLYTQDEQIKALNLESQVLKQEIKNKESELKTLRGMVTFVKNKKQLQEAVEQNLAFEQQVVSLKQIISELQKKSSEAEVKDIVGGTSSSSPTKSASQENGSQEKELKSRIDAADRDIQSLLQKLRLKEEEIVGLRAECKVWDQQVVDLKTQLTECRKRCERQSSDLFEKELKAEDRIRQLEGRLDAALGGNKNLTQRLQMTTENRSMLQQQLEEAKRLAQERAKGWQKAEWQIEELKDEKEQHMRQTARLEATIAALQKQNTSLQEKDAQRETKIKSLEEQLSRQEAHAAEAQKTLTKAFEEMESLRAKLEEGPMIRKLESAKMSQLTKDLQAQLKLERQKVIELQRELATRLPMDLASASIGSASSQASPVSSRGSSPRSFVESDNKTPPKIPVGAQRSPARLLARSFGLRSSPSSVLKAAGIAGQRHSAPHALPVEQDWKLQPVPAHRTGRLSQTVPSPDSKSDNGRIVSAAAVRRSAPEVKQLELLEKMTQGGHFLDDEEEDDEDEGEDEPSRAEEEK